MLYFCESELPENKSIEVSLHYVFGIGKHRSKIICKKLGFCKNLKVKQLKADQKKNLDNILDQLKFTLASELKKEIVLNNNRLILIQSYRGIRRSSGLPMRGQRTHTNAKTARKKF